LDIILAFQLKMNCTSKSLPNHLSQKFRDPFPRSFREKGKGYRNIILSGSRKQIDRLEAIFADMNSERHFDPLLMVLHEGFIDKNLKICAYTDHQIFERYHKFRLRGNFTRNEALTVRELTGLKPGDYVVHIDHGIARFGGLEKVEVTEKPRRH